MLEAKRENLWPKNVVFPVIDNQLLKLFLNNGFPYLLVHANPDDVILACGGS